MTTDSAVRLVTDEARVWRCLIAYLLTFHVLPPLAYTVKRTNLTEVKVRETVQSLREQGHIRRDSSGALTIWSRRLPSGYETTESSAEKGEESPKEDFHYG